jgi:hypothetical protein
MEGIGGRKTVRSFHLTALICVNTQRAPDREPTIRILF